MGEERDGHDDDNGNDGGSHQRRSGICLDQRSSALGILLWSHGAWLGVELFDDLIRLSCLAQSRDIPNMWTSAALGPQTSHVADMAQVAEASVAEASVAEACVAANASSCIGFQEPHENEIQRLKRPHRSQIQKHRIK